MAERRQRARDFLRQAADAGVDIRDEVAVMVEGALADSSRRTYSSAENLFRDIMWGDNAPADTYPISGEMLMVFAYVMMRVNYKASTIKTYVAGVKTKNLEHGYRLSSIEEDHLKRVLKTVGKRTTGEGQTVNRMEPITVDEARECMRNAAPGSREIKMGMLLSLFAVLRAGEGLALNTKDVVFDTQDGMDIVRLTIKEGKCDQYGQGVVVKVGCTRQAKNRPCGEILCLVHQLYQYMYDGYRTGVLSTRQGAPLLVDPRTRLRLSYATFSEGIRGLITASTNRVGWTDVGTHSLRRSGAWWMWLARIPRINRLEFGRWALDTTLEKFYLTGVTHTQSHKYARAMVQGTYDG
ncbi:hypothetical protein FOZ60_012437, partial [Perkinsus olseni]